MKKLMIAAAIVCAAAMSQAAAVSWTVGALKGGDGEKITNAKGYTFTVAIYDATTDGLIGSSSDTTISMNAMSGSVDGVANSHSYYAMLTASNAEYTLADSIANTKFYFTTDGSASFAINLTTGNNITAPTGGVGTWSASSWQAVPEPTSGLLLLLGVAGLALRRRRA